MEVSSCSKYQTLHNLIVLASQVQTQGKTSAIFFGQEMNLKCYSGLLLLMEIILRAW